MDVWFSFFGRWNFDFWHGSFVVENFFLILIMFLFDNNEIIRRLRKYPILNKFSEFALRKLVAQSTTEELDARQVLFHRDDACDSVYYLVD